MANLNKPLPYFRWYPRDYRASRRVQRLTYVERGLYRELLDECWEKGCIPDDQTKLAEICGCPLGVMAEAWPALRAMFQPLDGMDGMYLVNDRLEDERTADDKVRAGRQLAGRKGGIAKQMLANAGKCHIAVAEKRKAVAGANATPDGGPAVAAPAAVAECPECGSRGAGYAAGIHRQECSRWTAE